MGKLDALDMNILSFLIRDARVPYTDIAKALKVSSGTVHVRMRKLESQGIVSGSHLEVNYKVLGYDISAFVGIYLEDGKLYKSVLKELEQIPEVTSAHSTTGRYNIFARILCRDTSHLKEVLTEQLQAINGILHVESFLSLDEPIKRPWAPNAMQKSTSKNASGKRSGTRSKAMK